MNRDGLKHERAGHLGGVRIRNIVVSLLAVLGLFAAACGMPCGTLGGSCGPGIDHEARAERAAELERWYEVAREICVPIPDSLVAPILDGITWNTVGDWGYTIDEVYLSAVRIRSPQDSHVVSVRFPISGGQRTFALLVTGPLESPDSVTFVPTPWPESLNANPTTFDKAVDDTISYYSGEYGEGGEYLYVPDCGSRGLETGPHQRQ